MAEILVVFESKTDKHVFTPIGEKLKELGGSYDLTISSSEKDIEKKLRQDYKVIIAGAGIGAKLPEIAVSTVIRPVIGVPSSANYEGQDALLSMAKMSTPVMCVGVDQAERAAVNAKKMLRKYETVHVVGDSNQKEVLDAIKILEQFDILHTHSEEIKPDVVNIQFVTFDQPVEESEELVIYCPVRYEQDDDANAALSFVKSATHGLWVGLGNGENAAIAAVEILNYDNSQEDKLNHYREQIAEEQKGDDDTQ